MASILQRPSTAAIMPQQKQQSQRLRSMVEHIQQKLKAGSRIDRREFYRLCILLSRAIDVTVASNQTPPSTQEVLQLLKQICSQKDDPDVRPAVMVLMLSFKSAVHTGWFNVAEIGELLDTVNGLFQQYHGQGERGKMPHHQSNSTANTADAEQFICDILVRFYPWLKLNKLVLSTEAKPGYEVLACDFYIASQPSSNEQVRLFTIRKDRIDASACLMTPALVSFIMNGHGVEKRTIISMDNGPQIPTDCTKLIKAGGNLLQIVGEFQAPYSIVLACTSAAPFRTTALRLPEVQPLGSHSDDDLTEGPSRVSLCCPISRKRIVTPVKGTGCRHLQCFDCDNYLEINERRPSWRCPYCNVPVTYSDLRLDKKMAEVLNEVGESVLDVMIASDGSWEALDNIDAPVRFFPAQGLRSNHVREPIVVDLSSDDDLDLGQDVHLASCVGSTDPSRSSIPFTETNVEDRKPDINRTNGRATSVACHEQAEAVDVPGSFDVFWRNPVSTNAVEATETILMERDNPDHTCEVPVRTSSGPRQEFLRSSRPQIAIQALPAFAPGAQRSRMTASNRPCSPANHSPGQTAHNRLQSPESGIHLEQWLQQSLPGFPAQQFQDADPVQWTSTVAVTQQMQTLNNTRHNLEQQLAQNNQGPSQHFCQTLPAQYDPRFWQQLPPAFSQLSNGNQSLNTRTGIRGPYLNAPILATGVATPLHNRPLSSTTGSDQPGVRTGMADRY